MNNRATFPFPVWKKRPTSNPADFEALLEAWPGAAFLLEPRLFAIISANSQAADRLGYARKNLNGIELDRLCTGPSGEPVERADLLAVPGPTALLFTLPDGSTQLLNLSLQHLPGNSTWLLGTLEDPATSEIARVLPGDDIWQPLFKLAASLQESEMAEAVESALAAGCRLVGANLSAVYLGEPDSPIFRLKWWTGNTDHLPDAVDSQELVQLRHPSLWQPGKRASLALHRAARSMQLAFLTSAPLGGLNAPVGLVVLGHTDTPPSLQAMPSTQVLASALSGLIERQTKLAELQDRAKAVDLQTLTWEIAGDAIEEGVIVLTPSLKILRMNQAAELNLGFAIREVAGQSVERILVGTETLLPALEAACQGSATYNLGSVRLFRRTGEDFLARVRTLPVVRDGVVEAVVVLVQDQSEQEQIRLQTQQLEQRAVLGEITAIFAHEVRNPINNISTGLQWMGMNLPPTDPNQEQIQRLIQDCDRLLEVMKSVLAFARPTDFQMDELDIGGLVRRLVERMHPRMANLNIRYSYQIPPDLPPVRGNVRALEQVFSNLVNNAIQAMSETGGYLAVRIQPLSTPGRLESKDTVGYIEVSVADNGPGIPVENQERIFQPFFTTNRNGTGLGLAISKRIVTAHKGAIRITSFPGGTVFHVELPAARPFPAREITEPILPPAK